MNTRLGLASLYVRYNEKFFLSDDQLIFIFETYQIDGWVLEAGCLISEPFPLLHEGDDVFLDLRGAFWLPLCKLPAFLGAECCWARRSLFRLLRLVHDLIRNHSSFVSVEFDVAGHWIFCPVDCCLIFGRSRYLVFRQAGLLTEHATLLLRAHMSMHWKQVFDCCFRIVVIDAEGLLSQHVVDDVLHSQAGIAAMHAVGGPRVRVVPSFFARSAHGKTLTDRARHHLLTRTVDDIAWTEQRIGLILETRAHGG